MDGRQPFHSPQTHGFPTRTARPEVEQGECWYLNALLYVEVGSMHDHKQLSTGRRWKRYRVDSVDIGSRRVTMHDKTVFGYCNDCRWRRLSSTGGLDERFADSHLDIPSDIVHTRMPLQLRNRTLNDTLRAPSGAPRLLEATNPEAQSELDRIREAKAYTMSIVHGDATARAAEDPVAWEADRKPLNQAYTLDKEVIADEAARTVEQLMHQLVIGSGTPQEAARVAGKYS